MFFVVILKPYDTILFFPEPMSCIVYSEEPGYMELTNERSVVL